MVFSEDWGRTLLKAEETIHFQKRCNGKKGEMRKNRSWFFFFGELFLPCFFVALLHHHGNHDIRLREQEMPSKYC